jgi:hypothetical protein
MLYIYKLKEIIPKTFQEITGMQKSFFCIIPTNAQKRNKWVCTLLNQPQDVECGHGRAKTPCFEH